jgi:uncharacterized membrane protein YheB (UPF0754 family)
LLEEVEVVEDLMLIVEVLVEQVDIEHLVEEQCRIFSLWSNTISNS